MAKAEEGPVAGYAGAARLRLAREPDLGALRRLYRASVIALAPSAYEPEAVVAWAAFADDARFHAFVFGARTLVAEDASGIVGFAGLEPSGRIASLYVRPDRARMGVAHALLAKLIDDAPPGLRLWTEASALSRGVFERFGFTVVAVETVERKGVRIQRYRMEAV